MSAVGAVLASNVRLHRSSQRMSQAALAERMRAIGHDTWSATTCSQIERGGRKVTVDEMVALSLVLGVTIPTLLLPAGRPSPALLVPPA